MFPDWTDEDIVLALQETDGNLEGTIDRISEGMDSLRRLTQQSSNSFPVLQAIYHNGERSRKRPRIAHSQK